MDRKKHLSRVRASTMIRDRGLSTEIVAFFKDAEIRSFLRRGKKVLELGCGDAFIVRDLADKYLLDPHGIDLMEPPREIGLRNGVFAGMGRSLKEKIGLVKRVKFVRGDIHELPYREETFDFVYSYMAFPYLLDKLGALKEAHRVMRVGARAVIQFDMKGEKRAYQGIRPQLESILEKYPNAHQLSCADIDIPFPVPSGWVNKRVVIDKTSREPLDFPELLRVDYCRERAAESLATSCYYTA